MEELKAYSQLGQDCLAYILFNGKLEGSFVEIGAADGVTLSNTFMLEKFLNWRGLCIEPGPQVFSGFFFVFSFLARIAASCCLAAA